jgi:hypothetical protein
MTCWYPRADSNRRYRLERAIGGAWLLMLFAKI